MRHSLSKSKTVYILSFLTFPYSPGGIVAQDTNEDHINSTLSVKVLLFSSVGFADRIIALVQVKSCVERLLLQLFAVDCASDQLPTQQIRIIKKKSQVHK